MTVCYFLFQIEKQVDMFVIKCPYVRCVAYVGCEEHFHENRFTIKLPVTVKLNINYVGYQPNNFLPPRHTRNCNELRGGENGEEGE